MAHQTSGILQTLTSVTIASGLILTISPLTLAQQYVPPDWGLPGRRQGGGTRGSCVTSQPTLTALMPDNSSGTTTKEYPSFFWYIPQNTAKAAEFVLMDANSQELYTLSMPVSHTAGVIRFDLPQSDLPPLQVNQNYRWDFSLVCDLGDRSGDVMTKGWIRRIEPDAALTDQLTAVQERDRPTLYAQNGIWYDAVATLATLRQSDPHDPVLLLNWQHLLGSVGLAPFSDATLLPCCKLNSSP